MAALFIGLGLAWSAAAARAALLAESGSALATESGGTIVREG